MDIAVEDHDGVKLVRLVGQLIGEDKDDLVETVMDLLGSPKARIVLDLGAVDYTNSAGLSELVRLVAQSNLQEARVILASPTNYLAGVLEMTKLDHFFEIAPTNEDALKQLS